MSNYNTQSLRNATEDGVNWCCDRLMSSSGLTKVTVRTGEGESGNLWLFTLEYHTANYRYASSYAALRTQWESQEDFNLLYKELQALARYVIETAKGPHEPEMLELIQALANTWTNDCQFIPCETEAATELGSKLQGLAERAAALLAKIEGGQGE